MMKINFLNGALTLALLAAAVRVSAQKTYKEGVINCSTEMQGNSAKSKIYFTPDSSATSLMAGSAAITMLSDANHQYFAILVNVSVAGIKKAQLQRLPR